MSDRIYLDHNATTPVDPRVMEAMLPYFMGDFGNAASNDHAFGLDAKRAVDRAREQIATAINAHPDEIIFTSGATESDNTALIGVAERYSAKGHHLVTCVTEHKAVLDSCKRLETTGHEITYAPVDEFGTVDLGALRSSLTPRTILISVMAANNEIGTIAPLQEIGQIASEHDVLFHSDAAQAVGHIPIDVQRMSIHLMSLSAHKVYGPKGIGALYVRSSNPRAKVAPLIYGGGHERGMRSGTLNVPGIVGFGEAVRIACDEIEQEAARFRRWTNELLQHFEATCGPCHLNGHPTHRLPNNLNISFDGVESKAIIVELHDVAIATGSACTSMLVEPSHVVTALGFGEDRAHTSIRIGVGRTNTDQQIRAAAAAISRTVGKLRNAR